MKFEEKLAASMRRSWEEHYIDYKVCSALGMRSEV